MTKEEVLQKVNDYCSEKSYTSDTLTDDFKSKFADFFAKKYPTETAVDAEGVLDDIKFNVNTAFSAASKGITAKKDTFDTEVEAYKRQIEELKKKNLPPSKTITELPEDVQKQLKELENFKNEAKKGAMFNEVLTLAKKSVRNNLHKSLENYAADFVVTLDATAEEQARKLTARFQEIFKDSIGDIKPLAPRQTQKRDEDFLAAIPKVKI